MKIHADIIAFVGALLEYIMVRCVYKWFFILLTLCSGCASSRTINSFDGLKKPSAFADYKNLDAILRHHFTPEAKETLRDIPVIRMPTPEPYVAGVNVWSNLISLLGFHGWGRKVILPLDEIYRPTALRALIHEYIHQLDDMDRDGISEWINHENFASALKRMQADEKYSKRTTELLSFADRWVTNAFGIGENSEAIAYVGSWLVLEGGPDYMWEVFKKILKDPENTVGIL